jgi:hypothetical protein
MKGDIVARLPIIQVRVILARHEIHKDRQHMATTHGQYLVAPYSDRLAVFWWVWRRLSEFRTIQKQPANKVPPGANHIVPTRR